MTDAARSSSLASQADESDGNVAVASVDVVGKVVQGRYLLKRLIGEGGMGGVFEAEHLEIGRRVALKLVHTAFARNEQIASRLKQEARNTGAIESAHIVQVFDAGDDPTLGLYLVMELLHGEDLGRVLEMVGQLPVTVACGIVLQAARGLSRAHAAKIVHRDLKPANIFVCRQDDGSALVKLVDFGIAKMLRDAQDAAQSAGITRVGLAIGTPQYMSPEQAQGLPNVDRRTDIYSLGAVLFELITGKPPIDRLGSYEQTILQIITKPAPRLRSVAPDVPLQVDELCARMMAADPEARFADMAAVAQAIVGVFPELETTPLPYRVITSQAGDRALAARSQSVPSFFEGGADSVAVTSVRPLPTSAGVALTPPQPEHDDLPAGVPRRGGARRTVGVALGLAAVAGVALFASTRVRPGGTPDPQGLVQPATTTTPAPTMAVAAPVPVAPKEESKPPPKAPEAAPPPAPRPVHVAAPPEPPVKGRGVPLAASAAAAELRAVGLPAPPATAAPAAASPKPAPPPPTPTPAPAAPKPERSVGGTTPSEEF